jgi:predicted RNA binding protein YcfA (HicA-like mRNA interferase family)
MSPGAELLAPLAKSGFAVERMRGSHFVPAHSGETIGPGLLHKILRDTQLTVEDLQKLL